tara:strand:- start:1079 stop:1288 length:210 start_codon:yes stop_codon:yes gene_type:complete
MLLVKSEYYPIPTSQNYMETPFRGNELKKRNKVPVVKNRKVVCKSKKGGIGVVHKGGGEYESDSENIFP